MRNRPLILSLFIVVAIAQLYVPASMIMDREAIIEEGKEYRFKTQPIDPADPLRGRYLVLGFQNNYIEVPGDSIFFGGQDVFVLLKKDEQGFMNISDVKLEAPTGSVDYVKANVRSSYYDNDTSSVYIQYPFDRFYMGEFKAPLAEEAQNASTRDSTSISYAVVKVKDGEAVLIDVLIDDTPIHQLIEREP